MAVLHLALAFQFSVCVCVSVLATVPQLGMPHSRDPILFIQPTTVACHCFQSIGCGTTNAIMVEVGFVYARVK